MLRILLCTLLMMVPACAIPTDDFITARLQGRTGNLCFEIATTCALAWDHHAEAYFPDLQLYPADFNRMFFRCKVNPPTNRISEIIPETFPIRFSNRSQLDGYFQSEKYFAHHREKILKLFAPSDQHLDYIKNKYQWIIDHPNAVGVQLRYYRSEPIVGYPQYGRQYLEKAMAHFPPETLFVISSDNLGFTKQNIPSWAKNVYFLENENSHTDLFVLSLCKHNIISNSTFGWWAAWLNQNPNKIVVCPSYWTACATMYIFPVCPETWIHIKVDPEGF